ncbi:hypothetical protein HerbRD11066_11230 [Herbidospora sp. RD11066]
MLVVLTAAPGCAVGLESTTTEATPSAAPVSASASPEMPLYGANVVNLAGTAPSCTKRIQGSGFAYSPDRVLTTAHTVAGTEGPITVTASDGKRHEGHVVVFDPRKDVAVLRVPGLDADFLNFDSIEPGDRATFAAYSKDGKLTVRSGEAGPPTTAHVNDIYNERTVKREVLVLQAAIDPGMSGAPLFGPGEEVVGMLFAANLSDAGTGYVLTTGEIARPAADGLNATKPVSTRECDRSPVRGRRRR